MVKELQLELFDSEPIYKFGDGAFDRIFQHGGAKFLGDEVILLVVFWSRVSLFPARIKCLSKCPSFFLIEN